jgi:hypothetical protein
VKVFLENRGLLEISNPTLFTWPRASRTFLFPEAKTAFGGRRFQDVEGIKKNINNTTYSVCHNTCFFNISSNSTCFD